MINEVPIWQYAKITKYEIAQIAVLQLLGKGADEKNIGYLTQRESLTISESILKQGWPQIGQTKNQLEGITYPAVRAIGGYSSKRLIMAANKMDSDHTSIAKKRVRSSTFGNPSSRIVFGAILVPATTAEKIGDYLAKQWPNETMSKKIIELREQEAKL